jgi:hypothetical protein
MSASGIYDISKYTDQELYQILDVNNPSDRELEAKINQLLTKYENIDDNMYEFIMKIYQHFFDIEDQTYQEGFESQNTPIPTPTNTTNNNDNQELITDVQIINNPYDPKNQVITYQQQLEYTPGIINPLLKETVNRIIFIDSKYRDMSVYPFSSEYTFNLSESLNNVVRIKLYSVQIPYTWYTIDSIFGSNFFFFKGNQLGIDNDSLQISVPPGNYSSQQLIQVVNQGFQTMFQQNTDINFGQTSMTYNNTNNYASMSIYIQNIYNENNYYIEFPQVTEPIIDQYIYYTKSNAPYIKFQYFNINISPYILRDFINPHTNYQTITELITDISTNLQQKIAQPTLRYIISSIYDSSAETIDYLLNLDTIQNQSINNLAALNLKQLLFLTDLSNQQIDTFINLDSQDLQQLTQNYLTNTQLQTISQLYNTQLTINYFFINNHFTQQNYTDISNAGPQTIQTIITLNPYYIQQINNLIINYTNNQLDVLEQFNQGELNPLSYISDHDLIILRDISYTILHYITTSLDANHNQVITTDISYILLQNIVTNVPPTIWNSIPIISNIQTLYPDISAITPPQYQNLFNFTNDQLQILSQLTLTYTQYITLAKLTIPQLIILYDLNQNEINSLSTYIDVSGASTNQNRLLSTSISKTSVYVLSTINTTQLSLLNDLETPPYTITTIPIGASASINGTHPIDYKKIYNRLSSWFEANTSSSSYQIFHIFSKIHLLQLNQIQVLSQLSTQAIQILSQVTSPQITNIFSQDYDFVHIWSQLTPVQGNTIQNLDSNQIKILSQKISSPLQQTQVLNLSSAEIAQLSLVNQILIVPHIGDFLRENLSIAKLRLTVAQINTIQNEYQTIYSMYNIDEINNQTSLQDQYNLIFSTVTIIPPVTMIAIVNNILLQPDGYYADLNTNQQIAFSIWSAQPNPVKENTPSSLPPKFLPPLNNFQVDDLIHTLITMILYQSMQYMSQWNTDQLNEWNIFSTLQLSNAQIAQLSQLSQNEITQIANIVNKDNNILQQILEPSKSEIPQLQHNVIKLLRYTEYRSLYNQIKQTSFNEVINQLITYTPQNDVQITIPNPTIDILSYQPYYGWKTDEWIQQIQQQFQQTPIFKDSTIVLDSSNQLTFKIIPNTDTILDISGNSGYYIMKLYDPVNYPENQVPNNTLVWDTSQNPWYNYLHIPHATEIILSDTSFISLPDPSYAIAVKEKELDISGIFQAEPTQVIKYSETIHTLQELFGYEYRKYNLFQLRSQTFHGSMYNNSTLYPSLTVNQNQIPLQFELYVSQIINANVNQPISQINYTHTTTEDTSSIIIDLSFHGLNSTTNKYSFYTLIESINQSIRATNLFTSDSRLWIIDDNTQTDINDLSVVDNIGTYRFVFTLKPQRKNIYQLLHIQNQPNIKYRILFQDPLWTNTINGFQFPSYQPSQEISNIVSENSAILNNIFFTSSPSILFQCIAQGFQFPGNDISLAIPSPGPNGYTNIQYIDAIQTAFQSGTLSDWGLQGNATNSPPNYYANISFKIVHTIPSQDPTSGTPNYQIDFTKSIFSIFTTTTNPWIIKSSGNQITIDNTTIPGVFAVNNTNNSIYITCQGPYQDTSAVFTIPVDPSTNQTVYTIETLLQTINTNVFGKQTVNHVSMYGSYMSYDANNENIQIILHIQTILTNQDYKIILNDTSATNIWQNKLYIPDMSYNISDLSVNSLGYSVLQGTKALIEQKMYINEQNNYFTIKPTYNALGGVYINSVDVSYSTYNDIVITFSNLRTNASYSINDVINEINTQLTNYSNTYGNITNGSCVYLDPSTNQTVFRMNINMIYTTKDYVLDFFDPKSFTQCTYGKSSNLQAVKWDTTMGWTLGYHNQANYFLTPENVSLNINTQTTYYGQNPSTSYTYDTTTNIVTIGGDTIVNVTPYNSFFILLNDYTQSHINDGIITPTQSILDIPLASYAVRNSTLLQCERNTTQKFIQNMQDPVTRNNLTSKQVYSINQLLIAQNSVTIDPFRTSLGPNTQDIFAVIPLKLPAYGQSFIEYGGTLQNQDRVYFGPVNLKRISISLLTDKGTIINLNNADWSIGINVEQLYSSAGKSADKK